MTNSMEHGTYDNPFMALITEGAQWAIEDRGDVALAT